ncbi:MAG: hypothetical protein RLZZ184_2493 [Cyanobacteriota bacterium]|jgi:hypothetical protein
MSNICVYKSSFCLNQDLQDLRIYRINLLVSMLMGYIN